MKVAWLSHRDLRHPRAGGAERTVFEVGRRLVARGHEVSVVTSSWRGARPREEISGIHFLRAPGNVALHLAAIPLLEGQVRPDVVVEDLAHVIPWFGPWPSALRRAAFFRHLHSRTLRGQVSHPAAALLARVERAYPTIFSKTPFIVESEQSRSDLVSLGVRENLISRIPPGVDHSFFSPGLKAADPLLLYFGGLRDYKRPQHSISAFATASKDLPRARLAIVGAGPALALCIRTASRLGVASKVDFYGRLNAEDLRNLIRQSWVNIHCSVAEGWGYSILEASSVGVPTAAYDVPGVRETVLPEINGLLAPDGDSEQLASAVVELAMYRERYAASARAWAVGFDWEHCVTSWELRIRDLMAEEPRTAGGRSPA
jgi:glycosyltransferase involved in cell wall biosynthesis